MIDNLGESGKLLLARAARISTELHHYYIGPEHLFLAVVALGDPEVRRAFAAQAIDIDDAAEAVRQRIGTGPDQQGDQMILTPRGVQVLQVAANLATELHSDTVEAPHVLIALLQEGSGVAARALTELGVDLGVVIAALRTSLSEGEWSPGAYNARRAVEQPGTSPKRLATAGCYRTVATAIGFTAGSGFDTPQGLQQASEGPPGTHIICRSGGFAR
jgi:ATP-dependent Clp protease ATP-binding subunit ClpA